LKLLLFEEELEGLTDLFDLLLEDERFILVLVRDLELFMFLLLLFEEEGLTLLPELFLLVRLRFMLEELLVLPDGATRVPLVVFLLLVLALVFLLVLVGYVLLGATFPLVVVVRLGVAVRVLGFR